MNTIVTYGKPYNMSLGIAIKLGLNRMDGHAANLTRAVGTAYKQVGLQNGSGVYLLLLDGVWTGMPDCVSLQHRLQQRPLPQQYQAVGH